MMLKAYKHRIYPNKVQAELINKHIGSCRFVYNLALENLTYLLKAFHSFAVKKDHEEKHELSAEVDILNKPCLSINDILGAWPMLAPDKKERLIELVRAKL